MRRMLGHRLADAWGLAARAYDLLGREPEARQAYANATVLAPQVELSRRYPELSPLAEEIRGDGGAGGGGVRWSPSTPPSRACGAI